MDDPVVEVQCEDCEKSFWIKASIYEKVTETGMPILCPVCLGERIEEEQKANKPIHRKFEYLIIDVDMFVDEYGEKGWELVSVDNNRMYFKRELLEG